MKPPTLDESKVVVGRRRVTFGVGDMRIEVVSEVISPFTKKHCLINKDVLYKYYQLKGFVQDEAVDKEEDDEEAMKTCKLTHIYALYAYDLHLFVSRLQFNFWGKKEKEKRRCWGLGLNMADGVTGQALFSVQYSVLRRIHARQKAAVL
jgi:hypothetical protein